MYFFFFYPVGTESAPGRRPAGTAILLTILLAVFSLRYFDPYVYLGLVSESFRPSDPTLRGAVLSLFLHGGWLHLAGNALYLAIFGRQIEGRLGFVPLAAMFLGGGILACWTQAWLTPASAWNRHAPLIGASGSVAAILGMTVTRFPHVRVRVLWVVFALLGGMNRGGVGHVNTVLAAVLWFALQFVYGLVAWGSGGSATAYAAHAGGFLAGLTTGILAGYPRQVRCEVHRERARRYFERGDWHAAAGELTQHLHFVPSDRDARARRARCWAVLGRAGEAAAEYQRVFRDAMRSRAFDELARLVGEMRRYGVGSGLEASGLLRVAFDLQKARLVEAAAQVYEEITHVCPKGPVGELALIRRAEISWGDLGDYGQAQSDYRALLAAHPESEWRDLAEARLSSIRALTGESWSALRSPGTPRPRRPSGVRPPSAA